MHEIHLFYHSLHIILSLSLPGRITYNWLYVCGTRPAVEHCALLDFICKVTTNAKVQMLVPESRSATPASQGALTGGTRDGGDGGGGGDLLWRQSSLIRQISGNPSAWGHLHSLFLPLKGTVNICLPLTWTTRLPNGSVSESLVIYDHNNDLDPRRHDPLSHICCCGLQIWPCEMNWRCWPQKGGPL